ncbi:antibiotic biosynthesis monooxygenase [Chitinophaga flava]|uniref:Antibiotic biosynthesis monooxygenase n=2 Tax=Chitinophaga flava TaxID=2259036 RepID=A0A365Y748_9BACT|nr:antibiotic biosynthesis monooxygenase [Chitinophaga flava]
MITSATDSTATISLYGFLRPKKEYAAVLRQELLALVAPSRAETGNIVYNIHEEKDGAFFIYEIWRSQEDLDKHMQLPLLKQFMSKVGTYLAADVQAYHGQLITPVKK